MEGPSKFLKAQSSMYSDDMMPMEGESIDGWLISSPSTFIVSSMDLTQPIPVLTMQQRHLERYPSSWQLPRSQRRTSDISIPGMTDDDDSSESEGDLEEDGSRQYAKSRRHDCRSRRRRRPSRASHTQASKYTTRPASFLNARTIPEYFPTAATSPPALYRFSSFLTLLLAPSFTDLPRLDLTATSSTEEEVSHFDHDDDDDWERGSIGRKWKKILHIRSASNSTQGYDREAETVKKSGLRRLRNSISNAASDATETFRGVFKGRK